MFLLFLLRTRALKHRSREKACKITTFFDMTKFFLKKMQKIFIFFEFAMFG